MMAASSALPAGAQRDAKKVTIAQLEQVLAADRSKNIPDSSVAEQIARFELTERATPVIHIAGTNGKGSVAALLDACFTAAGWRTGLYTSPHLVKLGERVQVARQPLTEAEIVAYARELGPVAAAVSQGSPDDHPSFFEFMTAMGIYREKKIIIIIGSMG